MPLEKISDEELMIQVANHEMPAFQEITIRHQQRALSVAYKLLGNWHNAEDIAQDAFLKIYSAASSYKPQAKFTTWFYRIVVNSCYDHMRKRSNSTVNLDALGEIAVSGNEMHPVEKEEIAASVQQAIAKLNDRQRTVLILHRYERLTHAQISEVTGWTTSAVESLLVRAYRKLRKSLKYLVE